MGITRRAARLCFGALLVGAGAAAVAARPFTGPAVDVDIVAGDARLDLAWALSQAGMVATDAARVSVMLVDQVDPEGEGESLSVLWGAELWWREIGPDGALRGRLMRIQLASACGAELQAIESASVAGCSSDSAGFFVLRVAPGSGLPIPAETVVLMRLIGANLCGASSGVGCETFSAVLGEGWSTSFSCQPVQVDRELGVALPTQWPHGS